MGKNRAKAPRRSQAVVDMAELILVKSRARFLDREKEILIKKSNRHM